MNPKKVIQKVFDYFFEKKYVNIERAKSGRASPEKGDIM